MSALQCMGGWCGSRDKCAHYRAPATPGMPPVERLCGEIEQPEPMTHQQRTEAHRAQLLVDPRFAAWNAAVPPLARPLSDGSPATTEGA